MNLDKHVGIPFDVARRSGTDCWGLVRRIYSELGIDLPEYSEVTADHPIAVARAVRDGQRLPWCRVDKPRPYDVVLMTGLSAMTAKLPIHVGIVVPGNAMLHTSAATQASVIVPLSSLTVRSRIMGFYRHERLAADPGRL